jgi:hypothetical protein
MTGQLRTLFCASDHAYAPSAFLTLLICVQVDFVASVCSGSNSVDSRKVKSPACGQPVDSDSTLALSLVSVCPLRLCPVGYGEDRV